MESILRNNELPVSLNRALHKQDVRQACRNLQDPKTAAVFFHWLSKTNPYWADKHSLFLDKLCKVLAANNKELHPFKVIWEESLSNCELSLKEGNQLKLSRSIDMLFENGGFELSCFIVFFNEKIKNCLAESLQQETKDSKTCLELLKKTVPKLSTARLGALFLANRKSVKILSQYLSDEQKLFIDSLQTKKAKVLFRS